MIILNLVIVVFFLILWVVSGSYEHEFIEGLDEKQYNLKRFYPMALYTADKITKITTIFYKHNRSDKLDNTLKALYVGEDLNYVKKIYYCNKISIVLLIIFLANILALVSSIMSSYDRQLLEGRYIERPGYSEGSKRISLEVNVSDQEDTILEEEIYFDVEERRYSRKELEDKFSYAKQYIDSTILNQNKSTDEIRTDLTFVRQIPTSGLAVKWKTGDLELIDERGRVFNEGITEGILLTVTAEITYYERKEEYTRYVQVLPKLYSKAELSRKKLMEAINQAESQSQTQESLELPDALGSQKVTWSEKEGKSGMSILLLGCLAAVVLFFFMDKDLDKKIEKRNREMLLDYPEIINKFTLLVGAGMSLSNAWCKISQDYKESNSKKRYAYDEMIITYGELMIGTSETIAYERFGRRVKLMPYLRFSSLIAQNVKKGSAGLLSLLELEASEAFVERKELAKRMGEEAGTKLLLPMMIMLLIVLAIIMVPAFMSFGI